MSGGNRPPPCIFQKRTFYGGEAITEGETWEPRALKTSTKWKKRPSLSWAGVHVWPRRSLGGQALLRGDRVRREWSGQHAHPSTPQATASAKAEATRMTSASRLGSRCAVEVPCRGRPLRAAQDRDAGSRSRGDSIPRGLSPPHLLFPLPCSGDHSFSPSLPGHKTLPSEDIMEACVTVKQVIMAAYRSLSTLSCRCRTLSHTFSVPAGP